MNNKKGKQLIISVVLLLVLMYLSTGSRIFGYSLPSVFESNTVLYITEMILSVAVILINRHVFVSGFTSIFKKSPNVDTLVSIGSLTAFFYSAILSVNNIMYYGNMREYVGKTDIYFETAALIIVLVSVGRTVEEFAKDKTSDSIRDLMELSPTTAILMTPEGEKEVEIGSVQVGDIFILKPGMKVPVDGIVESGTSAVDESSLTGESIPVDKEAGMKVNAATINMSGFLTCRATEVGENTAFSHIVQMVKDASSQKVNIGKTSDRISMIFIPIVIGIAIITFVCWTITGAGIGFALSRAVAVLIISCPSALALAAPIAIVIGSGIGAKYGILFKTAQALENAGLTQIVVVDKTGTLTTGEAKVTDIISTVNDIEHRDHLLSIAYSLEVKSEHPLAKAICKYAEKRYVTGYETQNFVAHPGKGIEADIVLNGSLHKVYAGNEAFISQMLLGTSGNEDDKSFTSDFSAVTGKLIDSGKTPILFASKGGLLGIIAVADKINETSHAAIKALHDRAIHVVMVTGDRYATAKAVADELGIASEEVLSEVMPKDKADIVEKLKETGKVAMIGDGINDAPALTCADLGIAIGAGTDVAIDAADVVLVKNDLTSVVNALRLSHKTHTLIRQNLFWTFFYNVLGIPLAAGCFYKAFGMLLNPVFCGIAMCLSGILVILNSMRLFRFKPYVFDISEDEDSEDAATDGVITKEADS